MVMAKTEILIKLPESIAQDAYVERLGVEGITDCICGLGLPGHVALSFNDQEPDRIEDIGALVLGVSLVEEEAKIVGIYAPVIGLDWKLPY
jgi:hypothetical protein